MSETIDNRNNRNSLANAESTIIENAVATLNSNNINNINYNNDANINRPATPDEENNIVEVRSFILLFVCPVFVSY